VILSDKKPNISNFGARTTRIVNEPRIGKSGNNLSRQGASSIIRSWSKIGFSTTMPENVISDASRGPLVTRKKRVTVLASVIRENQ
jgi:hypothetical protein